MTMPADPPTPTTSLTRSTPNRRRTNEPMDSSLSDGRAGITASSPMRSLPGHVNRLERASAVALSEGSRPQIAR